jgi:uncharacterized protein YlxP (DUF503 family)
MSHLHAAAVRIELHINESQSLKAKRAVLRPLLARLEKLRLSVAEIGHQNSWQVATIAVAVVAADAGRLTEVVETVKRVARSDPRADVTSIEISHLEEP